MDDIKNIVNQVIGDLAGKKPSTHDRVERIWRNFLTKLEYKHTKIAGINHGTLSVFVDSPAWLYQMKIRQGKLAKQLNDEIPDIKNIRFRLGKTT